MFTNSHKVRVHGEFCIKITSEMFIETFICINSIIAQFFLLEVHGESCFKMTSEMFGHTIGQEVQEIVEKVNVLFFIYYVYL